MVDIIDLDELSGEKSLSNTHEDVSGRFPRPNYVGAPSYAKEALGNQRTELYFNYAIDGLPIDGIDNVKSDYPLNQVQKTFSGHSFEMDDTPGAERIIITHNTGAGIELGKDGSMTISTIKNSIQVTGGDQYITIAGDGTINYAGNLQINVAGDFDINCMNFNVKTRGNKTETIGGFNKIKSMGQENIINGTRMDIVTSQVSEIYLANNDRYVKGVSTQMSEGETKIFSGGNLYMTSDGILAQSADDMNLSANNMTVQGGTGIIGGTAVDFVGNGAVFDQGVKAPTFHGDLSGTATTSTVTQSQDYGENLTGTAGSITNTPVPDYIADPDVDGYAVPDASSVSEYLTKLNGGIRKVQIDEGFYIKNKVDPSADTGNVLNNIDEVTPDLIRSKLRNENNAKNQKFLEYILKTQYVNKEYFENKTPGGYGRSVTKENNPVVGNISFGAPTTTNVSINDEKHPTKNITMDPKYNAYNLNEINSKTKLSDTVTLSRFLGTHDPTNIDFIRDLEVKREIVKYLSIHAHFIEAVNNDTGVLKNMIIKPVESIYRPGEFEIYDKDSETDLKVKGRMVVYDVIDKNTGKSSPSHVFDLASFAKDRFPFEKVSLQYDTIKTDTDTEEYNARLALSLPELDDNYNGDWGLSLETKFNNIVTSDNELIEHTTVEDLLPPTTDVFGDVALFDWKDAVAGSIIDRKNIKSNWVLTHLADDAEIVVKRILENEFTTMMNIFGALVKTTPNGIFPSEKGDRNKTSQHLKGKAFDISVAGMTNDQKIKLVDAALAAGFQGFGFYNTRNNFLHIDMGRGRYWFKDCNAFAGHDSGWWAKHLNKNRRPNPYK